MQQIQTNRNKHTPRSTEIPYNMRTKVHIELQRRAVVGIFAFKLFHSLIVHQPIQ